MFMATKNGFILSTVGAVGRKPLAEAFGNGKEYVDRTPPGYMGNRIHHVPEVSLEW